MDYLIAGLGNVGEEYALTRHNIGFMAVDHIIHQHRERFIAKKHAFYACIRHRGRSLHVIKPLNYVNRSGDAVDYWLRQKNLNKDRLLVIVDDIALPFGRLRLRAGGGAGGHNGLTHIEERLKSPQYARLRIGIGDDFPRGQQVQYVLGAFNRSEKETLPETLTRAEQAVYAFSFLGIEGAMHNVNASR